jgi:hypothetical protein
VSPLTARLTGYCPAEGLVSSRVMPPGLILNIDTELLPAFTAKSRISFGSTASECWDPSGSVATPGIAPGPEPRPPVATPGSGGSKVPSASRRKVMISLPVQELEAT